MSDPEVDDRITELWDELPTTSGSLRARRLAELADHLIEAERYSEAIPVLETAEELYAESGIDVAVGRAAHNRAVTLGALERPDEQLGAEQASIDAYLRADRRDLAGCSRMALAIRHQQAGRRSLAHGLYLEAVHDFTATNEAIHLARALVAVIEVRVELGQFLRASTLLDRARDAVDQVLPIHVVGQYHRLAGEVLEALGHQDLALPHFGGPGPSGWRSWKQRRPRPARSGSFWSTSARAATLLPTRSVAPSFISAKSVGE